MVWQTKKLTEISEVKTGKWDANHAVEDGKYKFFTCAYESFFCDTKRFEGECIILPGNGVNVGEVFYYSGEFDAYQRTYVISDIEIEPKYLFYHLKCFWRERNLNKQFGSATNYLKIGNFKDYEVSFPPIPEQKRIVAILDQAFADIDKARALTEQNLKNARELFESYLQQVFSQRGEGWEVRPLESFSTIVNGFAFKSGDFSSNNHVKSIKITNVGVYEFVEESDNYLPEEFLESHHRYKAYEGDVVVALTRTIISSGLKVAVVPSTYDGALVNQRVAAVQVDESVIPKEMLQAYLSTKMAIDYVRSNVNELMQPNLSIKDLKQFPIPVPPVDKTASVMEEISELRESTKNLVSIYMSKLNLLDDLKKSLLQKAFSGDLTKNCEEAAA